MCYHKKVKTLTLIRHAKSSWADQGLADRERPLNDRGRRDAPEMGRRLAVRGLSPDLLLSSPVVRARTTAEEIAAELGYPPADIVYDERIYTADLDTLFRIVQDLDDSDNHVVMFGHNPGFESLADLLTDEVIGRMPTCCVVSFEFDTDRWSGVESRSGTVHVFDTPKQTLR